MFFKCLRRSFTRQMHTDRTPNDTILARITSLRTQMKLHQIDAYLIPSEDAHQSEYIAAHDGRRAYITNFTGSAGYALVTMTTAHLWTDGRYSMYTI